MTWPSVKASSTYGSRQLQRLPSHTRYPLTPSRLITTLTPSAQRSASRYTPRARASAAPSTPYGLRARQQRAANTPGRDRRRSGRVQRETTFDILRNLGRSRWFLFPNGVPMMGIPDSTFYLQMSAFPNHRISASLQTHRVIASRGSQTCGTTTR